MNIYIIWYIPGDSQDDSWIFVAPTVDPSQIQTFATELISEGQKNPKLVAKSIVVDIYDKFTGLKKGQTHIYDADVKDTGTFMNALSRAVK